MESFPQKFNKSVLTEFIQNLFNTLPYRIVRERRNITPEERLFRLNMLRNLAYDVIHMENGHEPAHMKLLNDYAQKLMSYKNSLMARRREIAKAQRYALKRKALAATRANFANATQPNVTNSYDKDNRK